MKSAPVDYNRTVTELVFLSHSGVDTQAAKNLAGLLRHGGVDVWLDVERIKPGDVWMDQLDAALVSARHLIVYIGPSGVRNWVGREVRVALDRSTQDPSFRLIPVLGPGADTEALPPFLKQQQWLGLQREADAALLKLHASLPANARPQADFARQRILMDARGWRDPAESVAHLPVLLEALWRERQVRFIYSRVLCDEASERTVDPLGLVAKGSVWYLVAGIAGSQPRTYRVSRIRDPLILEHPASRPAHFDLAAYWERSAAEFRDKLPRYYATFLANPAVPLGALSPLAA
jgi:hypothetical protein